MNFQIVEEYKDNTIFWSQSSTRCSENVSSAEDVERICRQELLDTVQHPYKDGCMLKNIFVIL